jgi:hypothetical protein
LLKKLKFLKRDLKNISVENLACIVRHEDFVDEDTGEVVSIERNEIILIEIPLSIKIMLKKSLILTLNLFCCIKKMLIKLIMLSYIPKRSNKF